MNKEILKLCLQEGFLLDRTILESLSKIEEQLAKKIVFFITRLNIKENLITKKFISENYSVLAKLFEADPNADSIKSFFLGMGIEGNAIVSSVDKELKRTEWTTKREVKIISSSNLVPKKIMVQDFVDHFRGRYEQLKLILLDKNLENLKSLRRMTKDRESYYIIVCVLDKRITKSGNILLEVEDLNGVAMVLVNSNKKELFVKAKNILLDEVIAIGVSGNNEVLFANDIIYPDSALGEKKSAKEEVLAAFISDIHSGSTMFLEENFVKFIKWLNGEEGSDQQKLFAKKIKYLFVNGDLVDGVGHFPGQEKWLNILDMRGQYEKIIQLFKLIRKDVNIIISPGNHDAVWVGEPQPVIDKKWAGELHEMNNVFLVTNPAMIEIESCFNVLMYHGASMHGIIHEIDELRMVYKTDSPTKVVKEMLKRRHLALTHGSVDYLPCEKEDRLLIKMIPDIITTADLHRQEVGNYNNILVIATSCWQSLTPFQEKVGNHPDFCKVPVFNLKTREVKVIDFSSDRKEGD
jgi:DNA polymerase II small subunit